MARATECDSANWPINLTPFTRSQNLPFSEGTLPGHRLPAEPPEQDATNTGSSVANSIGPTQLEIPGRTRACRSVVLAACKGWKAINSSASSSASGFRVSCTWRRTGAIAISESAQHSCEQSSCKTWEAVGRRFPHLVWMQVQRAWCFRSLHYVARSGSLRIDGARWRETSCRTRCRQTIRQLQYTQQSWW